MGILVNTGFDVGSSNPIDNRTLKDTIDERDALISDGLVYENLKVYCKDVQTEYRWTGTEWEKVGTGGAVDPSECTKTYTTLSELGLTADVTFQNVVDALPKGGSALLGVKDFTNYRTIFPYEEGNDQFARVYIVKGAANGSSMYARWFRKDGTKEAIAIFNINDNIFSGWQMLKNQQVYTTLTDLGLDTTAKINDIIGAMKDGTTFTYKTDVFDYATEYNNIQFGTVTINKQSTARVQALMTDKDTGNLYVGRLNSTNQITGWTKMISEKGDPYACTSYKSLTGTEDLFTLPCGHYVSEKTNTTYNYPITDSDKVTAHIYVLGNLNIPSNNQGYRIILYFDNKGRTYNANEWWGVFGSWNRLDNDTRVTTLETQVNELFQSVSNGKSLVANAITGKGVITATNATFATMATNISKIGGSKEETKSYNNTSAGITPITLTFSANVLGIKQVIPPSDTSYVTPQTSANMFRIEGKSITIYVTGSGTWKVTALIKA